MLMAAASLATPRLQAAETGLFAYPQPPDSMLMLQDRCDYLVSRFWQRCNFEQAVLHPAEFEVAFADWIAVMPHASADTVHSAVNSLLSRFTRKGDITLALAREAERQFYADTATYSSDELYLPFARAAAECRKIDKKEREHYAAQVRILEASAVGGNVPPLVFERVDGTKGNFGELSGRSVLLFFDDGDCIDCTLARIRLSTDPNTRDLIDRGELAVVSVYPAAADDNWRRRAASYPAEWLNVAVADAPQYFKLSPGVPQTYFLNSALKVLAKDLDIDYLLGAFGVANQRQR